MPRGSSILPSAIGVTLLCVACPVGAAEMYRYVDDEGRLHFTQDVGQVPPQYRSQVEKKVLRKQISVTGEGESQPPDERLRAIEKRSLKLRHADQQGRRRHARPAPASARVPARDPLQGAPEPRKYTRECEWNHRGERTCRRYLTPQWQIWNRANGGDNGKPDLRRKIGDP